MSTETGAPVVLRQMSRSFGSVHAVDEVTIELAPGSFTALLGPSGCGKSTLLALVAGLEEPDHGEVQVDHRSMDDVPAERRPIGLVFQKPLLFPQLNVLDNIAFGLRMQSVGRREARRRATQMLAAVQLEGFGERRVGELSGGQEQRVALARALVLRPRLLLLDEPFSQLDPTLRAQMRGLVRALTSETQITTVFVTHDRGEAVEVADRVVLMLDGAVAGEGPPADFYLRPPSLAAARFFECGNEVSGQVSAGAEGAQSRTAQSRTARFQGVGLAHPITTNVAPGPAVVVVRPEALRLGPGEATEATDEGFLTAARVVGVRFAGTHQGVDLRTSGGQPLIAHVGVERALSIGTDLEVRAPAAACTIFTAGSDTRPGTESGPSAPVSDAW
ncbi:MAG: ABC transporter ATP-binding protein [Nocardioidaceae bacterium]|nr:ABC transporter ATP-binding protein [Nocardioidaceae bacterium]